DRVLEVLEQHPRLDSGAGSKTDQRSVGADRFRNFLGVTAKQVGFYPSNVILGQLANPLEQIGPALVVKKFARQRAWRTGKAAYDFRQKIRFDRLEVYHCDAASHTALDGSRASRMPVNCQR